MTGEQALAIIQQDYDLGAGGGQLSNFVHEVLVLRNLGFRPSKANQAAIVEALEKRPNQAPLLEALKATVAYQRRIQAQAQAQQAQGGNAGFAIGGAPAPFDQGGTIMAAQPRLISRRARRQTAEHPGLPRGPRPAAADQR